ncbi:hypothetical protein HPB47_028043 [Ixodes persulcatus]|uniref:Uncharacterized protein n=1 Tax=Ixodes persulcatus TaxID=34615 RepID=A0AC60PUB9_IXOPE|nr:hypothetical protein HPB47_028043 [Ixodes persulcatus]
MDLPQQPEDEIPRTGEAIAPRPVPDSIDPNIRTDTSSAIGALLDANHQRTAQELRHRDAALLEVLSNLFERISVALLDGLRALVQPGLSQVLDAARRNRAPARAEQKNTYDRGGQADPAEEPQTKPRNFQEPREGGGREAGKLLS